MLKALLEIGCEEIPARFMPGFLEDLASQAKAKLEAEGLAFAGVKTLGTYRRLTLCIEGLAKKQPDISQEIKGPPAQIAFDQAGKPTKAAIGFTQKQGVELKALEVKDNYVFAKVSRKGQTAEKVLGRVFPEIITSLYQPLSMRWGSLDFKFIRPIHWLVALCGNKIIKFELAGIKTSNLTRGHRYIATSKSKDQINLRRIKQINNSKLKITKADLDLYKKTLAKLGVVVDQDERRAMIKKAVLASAKKNKAKAIIEEDLLEEVTFLVEKPVAYVGKFASSFLKIPQQVLVTSMKKNQKYFPLVNSRGELQAKFVVVTDGCKNPKVIEGNQKVLSARLSDAKFFFEEDQKQPLKSRLAELEKVTFFEKLGSMADKAKRMAQLSAYLAKTLKLGPSSIKVCQRICQLAKADLTTKMVYEFPELQGVMGREYALLSGESKLVAQGIFEHYLPRYAADQLPESLEGTVVALADRLDTLVGCFSLGAIPTGSVDPYGLRRAVQGVISLILEKKLDLLLDEAIEHTCRIYGSDRSVQIEQPLLEFIAARIKPILAEANIRPDVIEAVLTDFNDILDVFLKAEQINKLLARPWFAGLVSSADRIKRIARSVERAEVIEADLVDPEEKALFDQYMKSNWQAGEAINKEQWEEALLSLAKLSEPIELFFQKVLVMHKDERLKANRLALLKSIDNLYLEVADFSKIVIKN